jgi:hypothetical protein
VLVLPPDERGVIDEKYRCHTRGKMEWKKKKKEDEDISRYISRMQYMFVHDVSGYTIVLVMFSLPCHDSSRTLDCRIVANSTVRCLSFDVSKPSPVSSLSSLSLSLSLSASMYLMRTHGPGRQRRLISATNERVSICGDNSQPPLSSLQSFPRNHPTNSERASPLYGMPWL